MLAAPPRRQEETLTNTDTDSIGRIISPLLAPEAADNRSSGGILEYPDTFTDIQVHFYRKYFVRIFLVKNGQSNGKVYRDSVY